MARKTAPPSAAKTAPVTKVKKTVAKKAMSSAIATNAPPKATAPAATLGRVAFIGLGHMGGPMARNLHKAGADLVVFDLAPAMLEAFRDEGIATAQSAAEAVVGADVVISMLPAGPHVKGLYLGTSGVLVSATPGALLIDCSTIDPATSRAVTAAAADMGFAMLDAPVSGGTAGAAAGTLTFIVGGSPDALMRGRPYLERMGRAVFHAGEAGAGQVAKICNNMLLAIHMIGTVEALSLGTAHGLEAGVLSEIMQASSGRNWSLETYNPWPGVMPNSPAGRGYSGGFGARLMLKDLSLSQDAAAEASIATPLGSLARTLYQIHAAGPDGLDDFSGIARMLAKLPAPVA